MLQTLRSYFETASKPYIITGAPQCVVPDADMGAMIQAVLFDIIWVQYYNTPQCSARNWINANPDYSSTGVEQPSGFSYDAWSNFLVGTASANAMLYIGVPGAPTVPDNGFYLNSSEISSLTEAYFCTPNFGGIVIWEATSAENNIEGPFYEIAKNILVGYSTDTALSCLDSVIYLNNHIEGYFIYIEYEDLISHSYQNFQHYLELKFEGFQYIRQQAVFV
jgi:chitinase